MSETFRGLLGVARLEWRRQLAPGRALWLLILAAAPVAVASLAAWTISKFGHEDVSSHSGEDFANFYFILIVHVVLFFGCATIFIGQIRGELEQRSWHYLLLTPIPRWQFVVGKYLAGVVLAWTLFLVSTGLSRIIFQIPFGLSAFGDPVRQRELALYLLTSALGCVAYGGFFLVVGTLMRGPGFLMILYFALDWFEFALPPGPKHLSVVHYLKFLSPVPLSEGPFAFLAEPAPAWWVVTKILLFAGTAVALASWKVSRSELDYRTK